MDSIFVEMRKQAVPPMNPVVAKGVASAHVPFALKLIDQIWSSISREFPEGLVYKGYERCSPLESYKESARKKIPTRTNRRTATQLKRAPKGAFDIAPTTVFLSKFFFTYKGEEISPRYLYLPYCLEGGMMMIAGSRFSISPILQDIVISPADHSVFSQLLCIKLIFSRVRYDYLVDNRVRTVQVVHSMVYNKTDDMKALTPTVKMYTCMAHYLFCKYGVREAFAQYLNTQVYFGTDDINYDNYPIEDWHICESRGVKPDGNPRIEFIKSAIRVAVRKSDFTEEVENFIGAFFYLVDHFSKRMVIDEIDSTWLWQVLLGHILWNGEINEGELSQNVRNHLKSVDQYMDMITQQKLETIGVRAKTTYDFFVHVMKNFNTWTLTDRDRIATMYGKELAVLSNLLYDISSSIVQTNFAIHTAYRRSLNEPERPLTKNSIEEIFKQKLKPGKLFSIVSGRSGVSSIAVPGDNMAFKLTTILVPQTAKSGNHDRAVNGSMILHSSVASVGAYMNLQKKEPTGRTRLSP